METRYPLTVTGNGSSAGGMFKVIKIVGEARFTGDVDCLGFRCTGSAYLAGALKSDVCRVSGTLDVNGDMDIGQAVVNGRLEVGGDVKAGKIRSNGETIIHGSVGGERIHLEGYFLIKGRCEAEELRIKGIIKINGHMNADVVELGLHSRCVVSEIGGGRIEVRRASGHLLKKLAGALFLPEDFYEGTLQAGTIEGDDVYVEHTTADIVRGRHVTLGPGCRIGRVEYTGQLHQEAGSNVAEAVRTGEETE
ncbi:hypothetical protein SAMN02799630_02115 [Paenibacillus sp. UNCCL117]|uniref:hypothetical protein n=1 Tax=unclassified Paenibacillus TaxID=185978 RepID=UPI00087EA615|nr:MULTISPECIES: hypothetical protein [unclassified Paenibacillus]SDD00585.1 hypothetical protein SAMN04488602_10511 [Paenibacillus sp. cl123]SFW32837.1 hypothetical protein SAMN02799630_02115 [Paenibacillus sp. UNCCL117]